MFVLSLCKSNTSSFACAYMTGAELAGNELHRQQVMDYTNEVRK